MAKNSSISTLYDPNQSGALAFETREEVTTEIVAYLENLQHLKADFKDEPEVTEGLRELETKLKALHISDKPSEEVIEALHDLMNVPVGGGKSIRLDAFRKSAVKSTLSDMNEYKERVVRLMRNTKGNLAQFLLTWPDDSILQRFMKDLGEIDLDAEPVKLKYAMDDISKSPQMWHYNERKKAFLVEWLKPYQEYLNIPLDDLSEDDIKKAVAQVEGMRDRKLEEMTNLIVENDRAPFRVHNRSMHPIMNGSNADFWGSFDIRDEFMALIQLLISRFSINFEDRFLLFKTDDGSLCYLVGFADDAFDLMVTLDDGRVGLYPHLKVFLKSGEGEYSEITADMYGNDSAPYYQALKTAVVPFLSSVGVMLETVLSDAIKEAFDMWT